MQKARLFKGFRLLQRCFEKDCVLLGQASRAPGKGTAQYLSVKYSHPQQLAQYIVDRRGYDAAEAFLAADNSIPDTCLQVNTLKITPDELMLRLSSDGVPCSMHPWLPDCIVTAGSVSSMPGFDEGLFYVQDPAAKCAVLAAALEPGMNVLDSCAAPGGKALRLPL